MEPRRIALVMTRGNAYVEQVMLGVTDHLHHARRWKCIYAWDNLSSIEDLGCEVDGVLYSGWRNDLESDIVQRGIPAINVWNMRDRPVRPTVGIDDAAVGRLAARYYLERGFKRFGYAGSYRHRYSELRHQGFQQEIEARGYSTCALDPGVDARHDTPPSVWLHVRESVLSWLKGLSTPVAVLAAEDVCAVEVAEAAAMLGLRVPEDVAILGVHNDRVLCDLAATPLSSIEVPGRQIGRLAAAALDRWLDGQSPTALTTLLPPTGVVTRQSTDIVAVQDDELAMALKLIRDKATRGLTVDDVLATVRVSRRTLESRFRRHLGRSPHEEIERLRLERAKDLLANTDMQMPEVARRSGFRTGERLSVVFRRRLDQTPTQFRASARARAAV